MALAMPFHGTIFLIYESHAPILQIFQSYAEFLYLTSYYKNRRYMYVTLINIMKR